MNSSRMKTKVEAKMKTTMKTKHAMIRTFRVGLVLVAMPWAAMALSEAAETVTEFKNRNYLLIDRVVLKNSVE